MAVDLTIHDVPEHVLDELARRAEIAGCSLEEFVLKELVDRAGRPDRRDLVAAISADLAGRPSLSVDDILSARDVGRKWNYE